MGRSAGSSLGGGKRGDWAGRRREREGVWSEKEMGSNEEMGGVKVRKNGEGVLFFFLLLFFFFFPLSLLFRFGGSPFDLVVPPSLLGWIC